MSRTLRTTVFLSLIFFVGTFLVEAQLPAPPSPAGKDVIAYVSDQDGDYEVYTLEIGSSPRQITNNTISDWYPDWSPDGRQLAFGSGVDGADYEIVTVAANCAQLPGGCAAAIKQLTDNDVNDIDPAWSPDGQELAFVSDALGMEDIYFMNAAGGAAKQIIDNTVADKDPVWLPDGSGLIFSEKSETDQNLVLVDFGGETRELTADSPSSDEAPAIAPNGRYVAFHSNPGGNYDIFLLDLYTSALKQLTNDPGDDFTPAWSPDSKRLAFVSNRDGDYEIYVMKADGTDVRQITDNDVNDLGPAWKPAGTTSPAAGTTAVATVVVPTAIPTADTTSGACRLFSPDGSEVNIRSGPGTNYALLGRFRNQTELPIIGYNSTWYVVNYNGVQGWVANWVTERKGDCGSLAVIAAPPLPTALPATAVPTAPPAPAGAVIEFWADSYGIFDDQCTRVYWRVENIQAVAFNGTGVVGQDSREVCPDVNTAYTLHVTLRDGSTTDRVINVAVTPRTGAQPDLYVSEFSLNPAVPIKGQPVEVRIGVYNQGDAAVPEVAFKVGWWPGENYPAAACTWDLGGMAAHGGRIVTCTYAGYPSPYGGINTMIKIDINNTIAESNEGNNTFLQSVTVNSP